MYNGTKIIRDGYNYIKLVMYVLVFIQCWTKSEIILQKCKGIYSTKETQNRASIVL